MSYTSRVYFLGGNIMRIVVNGRNIEITDAIKAYTKEKFSKVLNHYDQITMIEVTLEVIKNPSVTLNHKAEVICKMNSGQIVLEETSESMYASLDLLSDKLARQVRKHKDKLVSSKGKNASIRTENYEETNA